MALPPVLPDTALRLSTRLTRDHWVRVGTCDYSVHPRVIGRMVEVRATPEEVVITCSEEVVGLTTPARSTLPAPTDVESAREAAGWTIVAKRSSARSRRRVRCLRLKVVWSPGAHHDRRVRDVLSQCDWSDDLHALNAAAVQSRVIVEKAKEVPCGRRGVDGMDRFGGFPGESPAPMSSNLGRSAFTKQRYFRRHRASDRSGWIESPC
jgi:hypothetical protein